MLRARLSIISADGAECYGGFDASHNSTGTCELLCADLDMSDCSRWDELHVMQKCGMEVLLLFTWSTEVLDIAKEARALFGSGQGSSFAAGLAEYLSPQSSEPASNSLRRPIRYQTPTAQSGTRMITHLVNIPARLVSNLSWTLTALSYRAREKQSGRGSHSITQYRDLAKRTCEP